MIVILMIAYILLYSFAAFRPSMNYLITLFIFSIGLFSCQSTKVSSEKYNDKEIDFIEANWNHAFAATKDQNKLVFIDMYATWCMPCQMMKNTTFKKKKIAAFFNENFINLSVDAEKGNGLQIASAYNVEAYPTLLFVKPDGQAVLISEGFLPAAHLMELAQKALDKIK
jgi:thiol:disulfide interchange protein